MREIITFYAPMRRDIMDNLYCPFCGNTHQYMMEIRLRHTIQRSNDGFVIQVDEITAQRLLAAISRNIGRMLDHSIDRDRPVFHCANCGNAELDRYGIALETCYNLGCPGCFHCGNWVDEDDVRATCGSCITNNSGVVDEEYCFSSCPHYDYGLEEVRQHYGITLEELISEAGYGGG